MEDRVTEKIDRRSNISLLSWLGRIKNSFGRLVGNLDPLQRYAVGSGAVAAIIVGLVLGWFISPSNNKRAVIFKIPASNAQNVELAGDFSGYKPIKMKDKNNDGVWKLQLSLEEGKYEYYYLVNGEKKPISYPLADETVRDWDNSKNGIRYIGGEKSQDQDNEEKDDTKSV